MTDATPGSAAAIMGGAQATPADNGGAAATTVATTTTAAPGATAAPSAFDWNTTLDEGRRGYVEKKGFKDPAAVVDSYQNLEKMMGDPKSLIKFPKHDAPAEEQQRFRDDLFGRLGRPEKPDGYKFPEGVDAEAVKALAPELHKLGLTQDQAAALAQIDVNRFKTANETAERAYAETLTKQRAELKGEWGAETDRNIVMADQAIKAAGWDDKMLEQATRAVGLKAVMSLFQKFGSVIGEDQARIHGETPAFEMSTARAREEIRTLRGDKAFMERYFKGDRDARARMEDLQKKGHPGFVGDVA